MAHHLDATRQVLMWFHDTWLGDIARQKPWLFTTGLVTHFVGFCLLIGAMLVVDLRLLGFFKEIPIRATYRLLPVAIVGFLLNLATGFMFFCFDPVNYWENPAFRVKLALLLVAGLNALWFLIVEQRRSAAEPDDAQAGLAAKLSAGGSLLIWFTVILFGRLIVAFQGSSDLFK